MNTNILIPLWRDRLFTLFNGVSSVMYGFFEKGKYLSNQDTIIIGKCTRICRACGMI